jgi:hypothetical protein
VSRKSKAYLAAARYLAERYDCTRLDNLDTWILKTVEDHRDSWDVIWKAARRAEWVHSQRDLDALQERYEALQAKFQQSGRLYDQVEKENRYHENALELAEQELTNLRVTVLEERERHTKLGTVLESQNRALNACTEKRNELLRRALAAEGTLASWPKRAEPRIPKKPEGDGWELSWVRMTGETIAGVVTTHPLVRCQAVLGKHACQNMTQSGKEHPQRHQCHCGILWS